MTGSLRRCCTLAAAVLALVLATACGGGDDDTIDVAAASSLRQILPRIAEDFERANPGVHVALRFAGSQVLAAQIEEGANVDLFISANTTQANRLDDAGLAERSTIVATNILVVAIDEDAPWEDLESLAAAHPRIAVGNEAVPVGALTRVALDLLPPEVASALRDGIVTEDPNVAVVLSRLQLGEVDAAFVYHSDVATVEGVRALALPPSVPANQYVAVEVQGADPGTREFVSFLLSFEAQSLLQLGGFLPAIGGVQAR